MSPTLSGHHTHHKDGAKLFAYGVTAVVVVGAGVVVVVAGAVVVVAGADVVVLRAAVVPAVRAERVRPGTAGSQKRPLLPQGGPLHRTAG